MAHDPALDAHEHTEHAEHAAHERDPFIAKITITVAVLAVLAAVAGSLETVEGGRALGAASEAVLKQDEATDSWNEFQADGLKRHIYTIAAGSGGALATSYGKTAKKEGAKQDKDKETALDFEKERDALSKESQAHEGRHHWLTGAARQVVWALRSSPVPLPWHRIVSSGGAVRTTGETAMEQRLRLEMEGVKFIGKRVDMKRFEHRFGKLVRRRK